MNKKTIALLHTPLSVDPNRIFTIIGTIKTLDRGLKQTIISVETIDLTRSDENIDYFNLTMRGRIKSIGDKLLEPGDLIHVMGQINCVSQSTFPEFEIRYFMAWDGMRNMFESSKVLDVPIDVIINKDIAY